MSIRRHLSYANVTATLALFIALGGISWAAVTLPRNSVGAKQIKRNAVASSELKDGAVKRRDLAGGLLLAGPQGPQGPKGDPGQSGAPGAPGAPGEPGTARAFAFVEPTCSGPGSTCTITKAKNIASVRRDSASVYCVQPAAGIDASTSGFAAGVDFARTSGDEGNASAMAFSQSPGPCDPGELLVVTERIPSFAPVIGGNAQTAATGANDVGFWILIP